MQQELKKIKIKGLAMHFWEKEQTFERTDNYEQKS